jgi:urease accessory protein
VRAAAHVRAEAGARGRARLVAMRSEAPLVLRDTLDGVMLVGAAGGPLGGDELRLRVEVGPGAQLKVGSVGATVVLPGPAGAASTLTVDVRVGAGGDLEWAPEPTVVARGAVHRSVVRVALAAGASLTWREETVLGRHGEPPGTIDASMTVRHRDAPLLATGAIWGAAAPAGWDGPAVLGGALACGSLLRVRPGWDGAPPALPAPPDGCALLQLSGPAVLATATAPDALTLRRRLDAAAAAMDAGG